jgi:tetratricopeptide (TPR) repeat protein
MSRRALLVCVLLSGWPAAAHSAGGGESWAGKPIMPNRPGVKIGESRDGRASDVATLGLSDYVVLRERDGWLQVRHRGIIGWLKKDQAVLLQNAVGYFTERLRQNGKDADAYAARAWAWHLHGENDKALRDYDRAIALRPAAATFHHGRGAV